MNFLRKHHVSLFFLLWFLIQLVQAGNTELFHDEAYYWIYSLFPAWGYFDHPPMIAMLIKMGYALFHNELGVRLMVTIMSTLTLVITYFLLPRKNDGLFYAIACSLAVLQIGGILAVPDIPLTFFVALFFWCYKKYLEKSSALNAVMLGVIMALMLYSKYHAVLIILFTFLSNTALIKKGSAYIAVITAVLLFSPHLYWQYTHGFPSVQFHLFERNSPGYQFKNTLEYLGGQLLIAGPITGWLLLWAAYKYWPKDPFEKALKLSWIGFYGFFLLSTLKGRVEANWTIPAFVPLIILSHQYLLEADKLRRILIKTIPVTLLLVLAGRLYMMLDLIPAKMVGKDEFHKNKEWAAIIKEKANGLPVVFLNTYQFPSKYWFYTGTPTYSVNSTYYRRNNFNFWPVEDALAGKTVYSVFSYDPSLARDSIRTPRGLAGGRIIEDFHSFSRIIIERESRQPLKAAAGSTITDTIRLATAIYHKSPVPDTLLSKKLRIYLYKKNDRVGSIDTNTTLNELLSGSKLFIQHYPVSLEKGSYDFVYGVPSSAGDLYTINSKRYPLVVE